MNYEWIKFDPETSPLPPERRYVLCQIAAKEDQGLPPAVAVGYLRIFDDALLWVIPGIDGQVTHYCDCLGDGFIAPLWPGSGLEFNRRVQGIRKDV